MLIKKRLVIISGALGVLTLLLAGAVGIPSVLSIRGLIAQIAVEQGKIDERYAMRRYVRNSVASITETKKQLGTFSSIALQDGKELDFVRALEKAATDAKVEQQLTLETVNQKDLSTWEREIPVKIQVTGQYPNVLAYMNTLERLSYIILTDSIQMAPPRAGSELKDGDVTANIAAVVYWQGQNAPDFVHGQADAMPLSVDDNKPL